MKLLWQLFSVFFNIGAFTIGGGYAMVPLIQRDVVQKNQWVKEEEFLDYLALAQSAPGVLAVNMAVAVGYRLKGVAGVIAASLGAVLPSFIIILIIASFWVDFAKKPYVEPFMRGARVAVIALLANAAISTGRTAVKSFKNWRGLLILVVVVIAVAFLGIHPILGIILGGFAGYFFFSRLKKEG